MVLPVLISLSGRSLFNLPKHFFLNVVWIELSLFVNQIYWGIELISSIHFSFLWPDVFVYRLSFPVDQNLMLGNNANEISCQFMLRYLSEVQSTYQAGLVLYLVHHFKENRAINMVHESAHFCSKTLFCCQPKKVSRTTILHFLCLDLQLHWIIRIVYVNGTVYLS